MEFHSTVNKHPSLGVCLGPVCPMEDIRVTFNFLWYVPVYIRCSYRTSNSPTKSEGNPQRVLVFTRSPHRLYQDRNWQLTKIFTVQKEQKTISTYSLEDCSIPLVTWFLLPPELNAVSGHLGEKNAWDGRPADILEKWVKWWVEISYLKFLKITRCVPNFLDDEVKVEIHTFWDASAKAYRAAGYVKI